MQITTEGMKKKAELHHNGKRYLVITTCDLEPCGSSDTYESACFMADHLKEANPGLSFFVMSPTEYNSKE